MWRVGVSRPRVDCWFAGRHRPNERARAQAWKFLQWLRLTHPLASNAYAICSASDCLGEDAQAAPSSLALDEGARPPTRVLPMGASARA